jgi:SAM-dependent methyltransferase
MSTPPASHYDDHVDTHNQGAPIVIDHVTLRPEVAEKAESGSLSDLYANNAYCYGKVVNEEGTGMVVDAGCGVGIPALDAARIWPGVTIVGVNTSSKQLEMARVRAEELGVSDRVRFDECSYENVPGVAQGSATGVVFLESAGYGDLEATLRECWRMLRPGGRVLMKEAFLPEALAEPDVVLSWISSIVGGHQFRHVRTVTSAAEALGFEVAEIEDIDQKVDQGPFQMHVGNACRGLVPGVAPPAPEVMAALASMTPPHMHIVVLQKPGDVEA